MKNLIWTIYIFNAINEGDIPEGRIKKNSKEMNEKLRELGWDSDDIRNLRDVYKDILQRD